MRPTVLSLPLQLDFPANSDITIFVQVVHAKLCKSWMVGKKRRCRNEKQTKCLSTKWAVYRL